MGDIREFAIQHDQQQMHFKVTSSAVNFALKGRANASIGLTRSLGSFPEVLILFGIDDLSLIYHSETREVRKLGPILSADEFRQFWLSWNGNVVKLGRNGCGIPLIEYHCNSSDMSYITFFSSNPRTHSPLYWKVELPPPRKTPMFKTISKGKLHWEPVDAETNLLPDDALIGGFEREILYIIRAKHRGSLTPGKFVPSESEAFIPWGGEMHHKPVYEVLCGYDCKWVQTNRETIPVGAVVAGYSENIDHEKLYVGRAKYRDNLLPGKVQPSHRTCYVPCNDGEHSVKNYEILVVNQGDKYADTITLPSKIRPEDDPDEDSGDDVMWIGADADELNDFPF